MSKKVKKQKKTPVIKTTKRADGSTEYVVTKAPQSTLGGKIVIATLALLLAGSAIIALVLVLMQL
ncbi:MAG: hypothetical protein IJB21_05740 [Bacilli bacterium]|nr:hypothetical protein [Bacilli bacterium]